MLRAVGDRDPVAVGGDGNQRRREQQAALLPERVARVVQHQQVPLGDGLLAVRDEAGVGDGDAAAVRRDHRLRVERVRTQRVCPQRLPVPRTAPEVKRPVPLADVRIGHPQDAVARCGRSAPRTAGRSARAAPAGPPGTARGSRRAGCSRRRRCRPRCRRPGRSRPASGPGSCRCRPVASGAAPGARPGCRDTGNGCRWRRPRSCRRPSSGRPRPHHPAYCGR